MIRKEMSLCAEATTMIKERGIHLAQDAVFKLSMMSPDRQTGYLSCPLLQSILDRTMNQMIEGMRANASGGSPVVETHVTQPVAAEPIKAKPADEDPDDEPSIFDNPFNLFDN